RLAQNEERGCTHREAGSRGGMGQMTPSGPFGGAGGIPGWTVSEGPPGDNPLRSRQLRYMSGAEPNATFRGGADGETGDFKGLTLSNSSPVRLGSRGFSLTQTRAPVLSVRASLATTLRYSHLEDSPLTGGTPGRSGHRYRYAPYLSGVGCIERRPRATA